MAFFLITTQSFWIKGLSILKILFMGKKPYKAQKETYSFKKREVRFASLFNLVIMPFYSAGSASSGAGATSSVGRGDASSAFFLHALRVKQTHARAKGQTNTG